jgi:hypothetical protein
LVERLGGRVVTSLRGYEGVIVCMEGVNGNEVLDVGEE